MGFTGEPFPEGTHMCYIYNNDEERKGIIRRFLESGLESRELVGYFADLAAPEELAEYMRSMGFKTPAEPHAHQWFQDSASHVYCPDGRFDPDRMLSRLAGFHEQSGQRALNGARVSGEMGWALGKVAGADRLIEYEARINLVVKEAPVTAICQYDARRFSGALLFDVLSVHPMMIVRGQIVRNPYYLPPEQVLAGMPAVRH
jgi:hypothetical protein